MVFLLPEIEYRLKNVDQVTEIVKKVATKKIGKNVKVDVVDVSAISVEKLLSKISGAKLVVGMSESSMVTSIFLPKVSAVLELFPFGLGPDVSSFIQVRQGTQFRAGALKIYANPLTFYSFSRKTT